MSTSRHFHVIILRLLIPGAIILIGLGLMIKGRERNILLDLGIAMAMGAVIETLVFMTKPGWFGPKSRNPDEN